MLVFPLYQLYCSSCVSCLFVSADWTDPPNWTIPDGGVESHWTHLSFESLVESSVDKSCWKLKASWSESELLVWRAAVSTSCWVAGAVVWMIWSGRCCNPDPLIEDTSHCYRSWLRTKEFESCLCQFVQLLCGVKLTVSGLYPRTKTQSLNQHMLRAPCADLIVWCGICDKLL